MRQAEHSSYKIPTFFFIIFVMLFALPARSQDLYPTDYFRSPVDFPIFLSGNFGEIRNNHFHSGIDIKTQGVEGKKVYAAADGCVSRIKVSAYGYGNALYLSHTIGYTTVYGHLQTYDTAINRYVLAEHYKRQSFELDLFPDKERLCYKKGDVIALSGNTGGSGGPHLHFEVRDSRTEKIINPLFFGLPITDQEPPKISGVMAVPYPAGGVVNGKNSTVAVNYSKSESAKTRQDTIKANGKVSFMLETFDAELPGGNKNGTYAYSVSVNEREVFSCKMKSFAFDQTRYINAHVDYSRKKKNQGTYQRCYLLPNNKLPFYTFTKGEEWIDFSNPEVYKIKITAEDYFGNNSIAVFYIRGGEGNITTVEADTLDGKHFKHNRDNSFENPNFKLKVPAGALYQDITFTYAQKDAAGAFLSAVHELHNPYEPLHVGMNVNIKANGNLMNPDKVIIVRVKEGQGVSNAEKTSREGHWYSCKTNVFGRYALKADTTAPNIRPMNFVNGQPNPASGKFVFKITDNLSGIKEYKATLNGQWILLRHDAKTDQFEYIFDHKIKKTNTKQKLEISVSDNVNNKTVKSYTFTY
jgi:murein DD-endopeptidase MepM/ murein hydrolase activator NlpD